MSVKGREELVHAHHCIPLFSMYYESVFAPINIDRLLSLTTLMCNIPEALYCLENYAPKPSDSFSCFFFLLSIKSSVRPQSVSPPAYSCALITYKTLSAAMC